MDEDVLPTSGVSEQDPNRRLILPSLPFRLASNLMERVQNCVVVRFWLPNASSNVFSPRIRLHRWFNRLPPSLSLIFPSTLAPMDEAVLIIFFNILSIASVPRRNSLNRNKISLGFLFLAAPKRLEYMHYPLIQIQNSHLCVLVPLKNIFPSQMMNLHHACGGSGFRCKNKRIWAKTIL